MEWEPNDRGDWVVDAERWIARIKGVLQCKIDLDPEGEVSAVHVVATEQRPPRQVVRDVEGLLKARLGVAVYYKKISVVQMVESEDGPALDDVAEEGAAKAEPVVEPDPAPPVEDRPTLEVPDPVHLDFGNYEGEDDSLPAVLLEETSAPRITCSGVGVMVSDETLHAEVELRAGLFEARGVEVGPNHVDSELSMIGRATVAALRELVDDPVLLQLSEVRVENVAGHDVVLAAVEVVEGRSSERLFGTCSTRHNRSQAIVHAVLDALNRRLSLMAFKTGEEEV